MNRAIVAIFLCVLATTPAYGAVLGLDLGLAVKCLLSSACSLSSAISGTVGTGDILVLDASSLLLPIALNIDSGLNVANITFTGKAGSVLNITSGTAVLVSQTLSVGASTTLQAYGQVTVAGQTFVGNAAAFVAQAGSSTDFKGGVNVDAGASAANQGLVVNSGATVTIDAASNINGALSLAKSSAFVVKSGVTNVGTNVIAAGDTTVYSTLQVASYTQNQGNLILQSSDTSVTVQGNVNLDGGAYLRGVGTIEGNVNVMNATVAPGNSPGTQTVNGDYTLTSTSTVELEVQSGSDYDKIIVKKNANLNGILYVKLLNNFGPNGGQKFQFITTLLGTVSGDFNIVHGDYNSNVGKWSQVIDRQSVAAQYNGAATAVASLVLIMAVFAFLLL